MPAVMICSILDIIVHCRMECKVGAFTFISKFDSGNLALVEKVDPNAKADETESSGMGMNVAYHITL